MLRTLPALLLLLLLLPALVPAARAQAPTLPALHDVTGVTAPDVLNVRENPRASAGVLGALPADATGIEVVALSDSGDWGRVNLGERSGWVSMRYLVPAPGADAQALVFDRPLRCVGTEPFWTLASDGTALSWSRPGADPLPVEPQLTARAAGRPAYRDALDALIDGQDRLTAVVRSAACSDGMSDTAYGLSVDALVQDADGGRLLSGCCTIAPQ